MVTHEPDIASFARRNVIMRDGLVRSDRAVAQRSIASEQLAIPAPADDPAAAGP
jgi:putative ABC transport system ATP-binding protein